MAQRKRPFTKRCSRCLHLGRCDWFDAVEAIEDEMANQLGREQGWEFLSACFQFNCQDYLAT